MRGHFPFQVAQSAIVDMLHDYLAEKEHAERLETENARLKAEVERSTAQYNGIIDTQLKVIDELKAEVERLNKPAVIGGYNISVYIRMANSETLEFDNGDIFADMTLPERIKYIVESHARLKAEVERLDALCKQLMAQHSDISCENIMLRKAGDALVGEGETMAHEVSWVPYTWDNLVCDWQAAKEGKQP